MAVVKKHKKIKLKRPGKKSGHFHTGKHKSPKTGKEMEYRSGWEFEFMKALDTDPNVKSYGYETLIIPYLKNPRARKASKYFPDFIIEYQDGSTVIVEIKSSSFLLRKVNLAKWEACERYCNSKGWKFEVMTEVELKKMGLLSSTSTTDS